MTNPLVSVLMTVYNREKYLSQAIESVLASTYQNWELIIVDDQSHDRSVEIARQYEAKDSRIKVYINEKNLGDYPNRNRAASYAKGKYLKYLDADDLIYPHCLEYMVGKMEAFPEAGYGLFTLKQHKTKPFPYLLNPHAAYRAYYIEKRDYFNRAPLSAIIKTEVFNAVGGFSGKQHVGDFELWNKLSQKFNLLILSHSHGFVWYREHEDQQMNDNRTDFLVPLKYYLLAKEFINADDCPLSQEEKKRCINNINKSINLLAFSAIKHRQFNKAIKIKKYSQLTLDEFLRINQ